jgi:hypothetical protein
MSHKPQRGGSYYGCQSENTTLRSRRTSGKQLPKRGLGIILSLERQNTLLYVALMAL